MKKQVINEMVHFCQRLIQTPSLSGREAEIAVLIKEEMHQLDYDEVWTDRIGNVIGRIKGKGNKPSIMFTAHMDAVDVGDLDLWGIPPYLGKVVDRYVYGRGASDTKGAIATQVYLTVALTAPPSGDIYVAQVVLEEKGGAGSEFLVKAITPDVVIIGEATSNQLRIGHRGRVEIAVKAIGTPVHASVPGRGRNPHYEMAEFLLKLRQLSMSTAARLTATVAPTLYFTDQESSNVTPGEAVVYLDWRKVPGETDGSVMTKLREIMSTSMKLEVVTEHLRSYTGMELSMKKTRKPYFLEPATPVLQTTKQAVERALGREQQIGFWDFVTDAGAFAELGIPVIGFSPCEETYAHTYNDRVSIDLMVEALTCYPAIVAAIQD